MTDNNIHFRVLDLQGVDLTEVDLSDMDLEELGNRISQYDLILTDGHAIPAPSQIRHV